MALSLPRIAHFRRVFSPVSETFIYDPLTLAPEHQEMITLVRLHRQSRPYPTRQLLEVPEVLQTRPGLHGRWRLPRRLSETERCIWPPIRVWLRRQIRLADPDIVVAHFGPDGCLIAPEAVKRGVPLLVFFYGYDVSRLVKRRPDEWQERYQFLFGKATRLIGISNHICQRLVGLGAPEEKIALCHLGTDLSKFRYRDPAADYDGGPVRFLHVGRLTWKKNPVKLIDAFAQASRRLPDKRLELTIAGAGELEEECKKAIADNGLEGAVHMLGRVGHRTVQKLMSEHHVYAQYCETAPDGDMEGLGVTFVEASACGLPVVSTRHNGIPDIVRHEQTGLLCEEGDIDAMASNLALLAMAPSKWTSLGSAGAAHAKAHFSLQAYRARLLGICDEALRPPQMRRSAA